jgi:hypothetical protein
MSMLAIAETTFRKLKEGAFLIMLAFAVGVGYFVTDIDSFSGQDSGLVLQLIGANKGYPLMSGSFFALGITLIVIVFTGATEIPRDIETRTIMVYIPKTRRKSEYLIGKFLGVLLISFTFFTVTELSIFATHYIRAKQMYDLWFMLRQFYLFSAAIPAAAIIVTFSCFVGDLSAMILAALYMLFSFSFGGIPILAAMLPESVSSGVEFYVYLIYYFFPNFIYFVQPLKIAGVVPAALFLYSLSVSAIFLVMAAVRIETRDMI